MPRNSSSVQSMKAKKRDYPNDEAVNTRDEFDGGDLEDREDEEEEYDEEVENENVRAKVKKVTKNGGVSGGSKAKKMLEEIRKTYKRQNNKNGSTAASIFLENEESGTTSKLSDVDGGDEFDNICADDVCDQPRQSIIKKADLPRNTIAVIRRAEWVDFKSGDAGGKKTICLDLKFIFDVSGEKCVRNGVDYGSSVVRFCLPRRFQKMFANINVDRLVGCLLFSPEGDDRKWRNAKDVTKSTTPVTLLLNNKNSIRSLKLSAFPSMEQIEKEAKESDHSMDHTFSADVAILFTHLVNYSQEFNVREKHNIGPSE